MDKAYTKVNEDVFKKIDPTVEKEALLLAKRRKEEHLANELGMLGRTQQRVAAIQEELASLEVLILDVEEVQPVEEAPVVEELVVAPK